MACFIVPAAEAVVVTAITKILEKKEKKAELNGKVFLTEPFSCKLKRLNHLLWGGSGMLAFEHLWHGEIQPFFPFLTALGNPADMEEMLHEMMTAGVSMSVLVTAVWVILTYAIEKIAQRTDSDTTLKGGAGL